MATTAHPETERQSQKSIHVLLGLLRPVIQSKAESWDRIVPQLEFELNYASARVDKALSFQSRIIPKSTATVNKIIRIISK